MGHVYSFHRGGKKYLPLSLPCNLIKYINPGMVIHIKLSVIVGIIILHSVGSIHDETTLM